MKIIIVDKPFIAKKLVDALGSVLFEKRAGYYESSEYIITWPFHHLFKLDGLTAGVSVEEPCAFFNAVPMSDGLCPDCFKFSLRGFPCWETQFDVIKTLVNRPDAEAVIHAGELNPDGEIMIRIILHMAGCKLPVRRLWAMMPNQFIANGRLTNLLAEAKDLSEYDSLARIGYRNMYVNFVAGNDHPNVGLSAEEQVSMVCFAAGVEKTRYVESLKADNK